MDNTIRNLILGIAAPACVAMAAASAHAGIVSGNSAASGAINGVDGTDTGAMTYNNDGDFLVAVITASSHSGLDENFMSPTVTYGGMSLTQVTQGRYRGYGWAAVYYLTDPTVGEASFSVDFGGNFVPVDNGAWEFGLISLFNVDETAPVAGSVGSNNIITSTIDSATPGAISAGDFLLVGDGAQYEIATPHYHVPTGSELNFYHNGSPNVGTNREEYASTYATLASGDLSGSNNDELIIAPSRPRSGGLAAVVFNAVPEPTSLALLALGSLVLAQRRSCKSAD